MNRLSLPMALVLMLVTALVVPPAVAAPVERELLITLSVDGTQNWRNDKQWSKTSTQQRYEISTRLRSDGRLYVDNLLNADLEQRMRIKTEFYTYRGLLELKRENAGRMPSYAEVAHKISGDSPELLEAHGACVDAADCPSAVAERFAAITALQHNSSVDLEAFIASYDEPGGRYMVFSGYEGCSNRLHLQNRSHFAGEQAYDRDRKKLQPFTLDWTADTQGSVAEQRRLCERYVVVVDTANGQFFVENAYIPAPRGKAESVISGKRSQVDADLPVPSEVMRWVGDRLSKTSESGRQSATLRLSRPLDGNATVLGEFDGNGRVELSWSFKKLVESSPKAKKD